MIEPISAQLCEKTVWQEMAASWKDPETAQSKVSFENTGMAHLNLSALITFCPFYEPGDLATSQLSPAPAEIGESRVANKWKALQSVLGAAAKYQHETGNEFCLTAVFANKGVLLGAEPTDEDSIRLAHHGEVYQQAIGDFCTNLDIPLTFTDYTECSVSFPDFVNPSDEIPVEGLETDFDMNTPGFVVDALNTFSANCDLPTKLTQNRGTRRKIEYLTEAFGPETTFWLTAGYLAFDYKIPEMVGKGGVYLATERFAPIFRISNLTPSLKQLARVNISA